MIPPASSPSSSAPAETAGDVDDDRPELVFEDVRLLLHGHTFDLFCCISCGAVALSLWPLMNSAAESLFENHKQFMVACFLHHGVYMLSCLDVRLA